MKIESTIFLHIIFAVYYIIGNYFFSPCDTIIINVYDKIDSID